MEASGLAAVPDPTAPDVDLPGEGEDDDAELHAEVMIEGDGQLTLSVGGKSPNVSKIVIRGGAIPMSGQMKKGEHVTVALELVCAEVHVIDKIDSKTRDVVETIRKHVLKAEGARLIPTSSEGNGARP